MKRGCLSTNVCSTSALIDARLAMSRGIKSQVQRVTKTATVPSNPQNKMRPRRIPILAALDCTYESDILTPLHLNYSFIVEMNSSPGCHPGSLPVNLHRLLATHPPSTHTNERDGRRGPTVRDPPSGSDRQGFDRGVRLGRQKLISVDVRIGHIVGDHAKMASVPMYLLPITFDVL